MHDGKKRMDKLPHGLTAAIMLIAITFLLPTTAFAEFYRYVTEDGRVYYVDDLTKVPEQYLDQLKVYREQYDHLPESERLIMLQKERELDQQRIIEENNRILEEKRISEEQERAEKLKLLETDVVIQGNQVLVPVTIGHGIKEQEAMFLLDTGAARMVLFREFANQFDIIPELKGMSQVAGGGLVPADMVIIDSIKVGPMQVTDAPATIIENVTPNGRAFNFSGLLGMNILRNLEYTIDFKNKKIRWILPPQ
jgi:DNA-binding transcriptional MerR regulator